MWVRVEGAGGAGSAVTVDPYQGRLRATSASDTSTTQPTP